VTSALRANMRAVDCSSGDLLVGLAGGAIGAILTAVGVVLVRLSAVPADVDRNDRRARALDEDLERWVADEHRALRQELAGITTEYGGRGLLYSGAILGALAEAKAGALRRYRDRRGAAERAFGDLLAAESWPHETWRRILRRGRLDLRSPGRVEPVIEEWRRDVDRFGIGPAAVHDPTRLTTEDVLRDVRENPLEPPAAEAGE
jgi:hypothetical protein